MPSVPFPLKPGKPDVEFKFNIKSADDYERMAGCSSKTLQDRGQYIQSIVFDVWAGLRHADPKLTIDKARDLVNTYVDAGGDIVKLFEALRDAWNMSGVYGPRRAKETEASDDEQDEGSERPTQTTQTTD